MTDLLTLVSGSDFGYSCEPPVGPLLATLAAAVPPGGRILEIGTGAGVGTAWLCRGLTGRADATVVTIENDAVLAASVRAAPWPAWVTFVVGDAEAELPRLGTFDLLFADAYGGKWVGLELTLAALRPGGVLLLDDMDPQRHAPEHHATLAGIVEALRAELVVTQLAVGSGLVLAARQLSPL